MSVINQVLLDLEKRRASAAERGAMPNHVRTLPDEVRPFPWGWIAGGLGAVAAAGAAWMLLGSGLIRNGAPAPRNSTDAAIETRRRELRHRAERIARRIVRAGTHVEARDLRR